MSGAAGKKFSAWLKEFDGEDFPNWIAACSSCGNNSDKCKCMLKFSKGDDVRPATVRPPWTKSPDGLCCHVGCTAKVTQMWSQSEHCRSCGKQFCQHHCSKKLPLQGYRTGVPCCEVCTQSFFKETVLLTVMGGPLNTELDTVALLLKHYTKARYGSMVKVEKHVVKQEGTSAAPLQVQIETSRGMAEGGRLDVYRPLTWEAGCLVRNELENILKGCPELAVGGGVEPASRFSLKVVIGAGQAARMRVAALLLKDLLPIKFPKDSVSIAVQSVPGCPSCPQEQGVLERLPGNDPPFVCHGCGVSCDEQAAFNNGPKDLLGVAIKCTSHYSHIIPSGPIDTPHRLALLHFSIVSVLQRPEVDIS